MNGFLVSDPVLGTDALASPSRFTPGMTVNLTECGCTIVFIRSSARSAVAAPKGSAMGLVRQSVAGAGVGVYTADLSDSNSIQSQPVMALNNFESSAGTKHFGWALAKGRLSAFNAWFTKQGGTSIIARAISVGANAQLQFKADAKFTSLAVGTIAAASWLKRCGRSRIAVSGSAMPGLILNGEGF